MQSNFAKSFSDHKETSFIEKAFFTSVYELRSGCHGSHSCIGEVIDAYAPVTGGVTHDGKPLVTLTQLVYNHSVQLHTNVSLLYE